MEGRNARSALIIATEAADVGGGLRATLPFVGRTLIEHQVRQAAAAGATHVVVLVATMPPALLAALDRLRRDGVALDVARNLADAADRVHPAEPVLLIADGCLADQPTVAQVADAAGLTLLVQGATEAAVFERLDATHAWGGLALVDGDLVRRTAAAPGDWDAQSTLLRRMVQAGAARIETGSPPRLVRTAEAGSAALAALVAASRPRAGSWPRRWLFPLVDGAAVGQLAARAIDPVAAAGAATALGLLSGASACGGWPGGALAAFLASGPVMAIARRLAATRLSVLPHAAVWDAARCVGGAVARLATAARLSGWGWLLTGVVGLAAILAARREAIVLARHGAAIPWIVADADALGWAALAGWIALGWSGAVAAVALYAAASFALVQERVLRTV